MNTLSHRKRITEISDFSFHIRDMLEYFSICFQLARWWLQNKLKLVVIVFCMFVELVISERAAWLICSPVWAFLWSCWTPLFDDIKLLAYFSPIYFNCPRMVPVFNSYYGIKEKGFFFSFWWYWSDIPLRTFCSIPSPSSISQLMYYMITGIMSMVY